MSRHINMNHVHHFVWNTMTLYGKIINHVRAWSTGIHFDIHYMTHIELISIVVSGQQLAASVHSRLDWSSFVEEDHFHSLAEEHFHSFVDLRREAEQDGHRRQAEHHRMHQAVLGAPQRRFQCRE